MAIAHADVNSKCGCDQVYNVDAVELDCRFRSLNEQQRHQCFDSITAAVQDSEGKLFFSLMLLVTLGRRTSLTCNWKTLD